MSSPTFAQNLQPIQEFLSYNFIAKTDPKQKQFLQLTDVDGQTQLKLVTQKPSDTSLKKLVNYVLSFQLENLSNQQRENLQDLAGAIKEKVNRYNSKWYRRILTFLQIDTSRFNSFQTKVSHARFQGALEEANKQQQKKPIQNEAFENLKLQILSDPSNLSKKSIKQIQALQEQVRGAEGLSEDISLLQDVLSNMLHSASKTHQSLISNMPLNLTLGPPKPYFVVRQDGDGNCLFHTFSYGIRLRWQELNKSGSLAERFKTHGMELPQPAINGEIYTTQQLRQIAHKYLDNVLNRKGPDAEKNHVRMLLDFAIADQNKGPRAEIRKCLRSSCDELLKLLDPKISQALIKKGLALKATDKQGRAWAKGSDDAVEAFIKEAAEELQSKYRKFRTKAQGIIDRLGRVQEKEGEKIIWPGLYSDYVKKILKNGYYASFPELYALRQVFGMNVQITLNADSHYPEEMDWSEYFPPLEGSLTREPLHLDFEGG